ncbi:hypothetical protein GGG16DRAFT_108691 [Schizophyllum commune]
MKKEGHQHFGQGHHGGPAPPGQAYYAPGHGMNKHHGGQGHYHGGPPPQQYQPQGQPQMIYVQQQRPYQRDDSSACSTCCGCCAGCLAGFLCCPCLCC